MNKTRINDNSLLKALFFIGFILPLTILIFSNCSKSTSKLIKNSKNIANVKKATKKSTNVKKSKLELKEDSFDFGYIKQEKKIEHIFKFKNAGDKTLIIEKPRTSCDCTTVEITPRVVKPKGSGEIKISVDPIGKQGKLVKTIIINSNDYSRPQKKIRIFAMVRHKVNSNPNLKMEEVLFSKKCKKCHADRAKDKTGKILYDAICAYCHGYKGEGKSAPPFKKRSRKYINNRIAKGKQGSGMAAYSKAKGGPLSNNQIDTLVDHIELLVSNIKSTN